MIVDFQCSYHEVLLPSITSTELRKIVILPRGGTCSYMLFWGQLRLWASVDKQLCEVVDRLRAMGHPYMLEVELWFTQVEGDPGEIDFTKVLPEFREKGVVTVIDGACGGLTYRSSTHNA